MAINLHPQQKSIQGRLGGTVKPLTLDFSAQVVIWDIEIEPGGLGSPLSMESASDSLPPPLLFPPCIL